MEHFYDGQIRRYLNQLIRMMSGFSYKTGSGEIRTVPVVYGDISRQAANIIRDNSENKIANAPRMGLYVTGLELDRNRLADSSYTNKVNIRERAFDQAGNEYLNTDGKNYTVERLMPTPYTLSINVDVWSSNTDQKLQILEQIFMLFNPSLEIQTTDNYLDWTSLSTVELQDITWTSRSIPAGTESEIDVSTLGFSTPIFISPPAKVKRLGVVTDIVTRIAGETDVLQENPQGTGTGNPGDPITIDTGFSEGEANIRTGVTITDTGEIQRTTVLKDWDYDPFMMGIRKTAYQDLELLVFENKIKLIKNGIVGGMTWDEFLTAIPEKFEAGITQVRLRRSDWQYEINGSLAISPLDSSEAIVDWDEDTIPTDSVIPGPNGDRSKIDFIIDPTKSNPQNLGLSANPRILLLGDIGNEINEDGADAWKNLDGTDFVAEANDIVEWDGSKWNIVFDASDNDSSEDIIYTTNLNTGVQYKFDTGEWILSFEGEYPVGTWRLNF